MFNDVDRSFDIGGAEIPHFDDRRAEKLDGGSRVIDVFRAEAEREIQRVEQIVVIRIVIISAVKWSAFTDENRGNAEEQNRNRQKVKPCSVERLHRVGRAFNSEFILTPANGGRYASSQTLLQTTHRRALSDRQRPAARIAQFLQRDDAVPTLESLLVCGPHRLHLPETRHLCQWSGLAPSLSRSGSKKIGPPSRPI